MVKKSVKVSKGKSKKEERKRLIVVHGWEGSPEHGWFPWLKSEMEKRGWQVQIPAMPSAAAPKVYEWVPYLLEVAGRVDENTFMIGHSLGCVTILKFLESLPKGKMLGGAILVAGFDNSLTFKELENFFDTPIDWEKAKKKCKKFVSIHSENDPSVPVENSIKFEKGLGAKKIIVDGYKHFSGDDGFTSLPLILEELLEISQ